MARSEEAQIAEARVAIEKAGGSWHEDKKGCLELMVLLPFLGVIYYVYQILSG